MPQLTNKERLTFLGEREVLMRIGVVRPDGSPLVTPIWFIHDSDTIYFTPRAQSEWFECLKQDVRVSLCIDEQTLPYRKVVVEGDAEMIHDIGEDNVWRDLYRKIALRYGANEMADAYIQNTIDQERALFRVQMENSKVRTWRMPLEGESVTGIWHNRYYAPGTKFSKN